MKSWPVSAARYALDTNVLSELRRGTPHPAVARWSQSVNVTDLFLPAVVLMELRHDAAHFAATVTSRPDAPRLADIMIAGPAHVHGMAVATRNVQDFARTGVAALNPWES